MNQPSTAPRARYNYVVVSSRLARHAKGLARLKRTNLSSVAVVGPIFDLGDVLGFFVVLSNFFRLGFSR